MTRRPTCEELEQRIKHIEKETAKPKRAKAELRDSREQLHSLASPKSTDNRARGGNG
jgi:hypothetical protein